MSNYIIVLQITHKNTDDKETTKTSHSLFASKADANIKRRSLQEFVMLYGKKSML